MYQSDIKIFELILLLKSLGKIKFDKDFCESIDMQKQNLLPIKKGLVHFTAKQIETICNVYDVNANWIFGKDNNIFNQVKPSSIKKQIE